MALLPQFNFGLVNLLSGTEKCSKLWNILKHSLSFHELEGKTILKVAYESDITVKNSNNMVQYRDYIF